MSYLFAHSIVQGAGPTFAYQLLCYTLFMRNEFTAIIERDGEWFVGWSPKVPGANGQRRSVDECRESLSAAIELIEEDGMGLKPHFSHLKNLAARLKSCPFAH
ncbi:MAG: type II toxin-antitoxin system HicB family antitoxin [Terracidiphilus sp.]|jgi:predicted RNase H-like HicB family nuclease